ncbi:MAG: hypothetical protein ACXVPU_00895 [Bacteroidia bacterium]
MKRILLVQITLLLSTICFAADTTRYDTGEIQYISKRHCYFKEYYKNGILKEHTISDTFFRKGRKRQYDENGKLSAKGKFMFSYVEQGRWVYYSNGKKDSVVHYKYGLHKKELRTAKGRRIKCILTYGFAPSNYEPCDKALEKYRVRYVAVSGCTVTNNIIFRTGIHNSILYIRKSIRFGSKWEDKMDKDCGRQVRAMF